MQSITDSSPGSRLCLIPGSSVHHCTELYYVWSYGDRGGGRF
ncbi:hypothetical protein D082_04500 [Synechocystis sp. PCC 6714]|nr:hypothetical protein D082_04500 [Synechocystis sp. PCC 6714]